MVRMGKEVYILIYMKYLFFLFTILSTFSIQAETARLSPKKFPDLNQTFYTHALDLRWPFPGSMLATEIEPDPSDRLSTGFLAYDGQFEERILDVPGYFLAVKTFTAALSAPVTEWTPRATVEAIIEVNKGMGYAGEFASGAPSISVPNMNGFPRGCQFMNCPEMRSHISAKMPKYLNIYNVLDSAIKKYAQKHPYNEEQLWQILSQGYKENLKALSVKQTDWDISLKFFRNFYTNIPVKTSEAYWGELGQIIEQTKKHFVDDPIKAAAFIHQRFVKLHPFPDGNGRTARLLMNLILRHGGYPNVIIFSDWDYSVAISGKEVNFERFLRKRIHGIVLSMTEKGNEYGQDLITHMDQCVESARKASREKSQFNSKPCRDELVRLTDKYLAYDTQNSGPDYDL